MSKRKGPMDAFLKDNDVPEKKGHNAKTGKWSKIGKELLIYTPDGMINRSKIAGFDVDGTLVSTKSGKAFPINEFDWKFAWPNTREKVKKSFDDEYKIVFFTNQKGILTGKQTPESQMNRMESISNLLKLPVQIFISTGTLNFRKPFTGMWEHLEKNCNGEVNIDRSNSFYVGDAAGRLPNNERKKDHSAADRLFSKNLGVKFYTPEQFFLEAVAEEPYILPAFNPSSFLSTKRSPYEPADTNIPSERQEIIVLVGFPGSGKSFFASQLVNEHGYACVNRDTLKTWQKCVEVANVHLRKGKSVIVDNTNLDAETRKRYCVLAKQHGVDCRCLVFNCDINQAYHMCKYRAIADTDPNHSDIGIMVLRMHKSKYTEPKLEEGYSAIVHVNFVPNFKNEGNERIFRMYLCDN